MIFKNTSRQNFTKIDNFVIQKESDISWRALGLLTYLVSLPQDWSISIERLGKIRAEGRDAVRTAMNELVIAGYVVKRGRKKMPDGKLGEFLYDVSDIKWTFQSGENSSVFGNPEGEQSELDDPAQEEAHKIKSTADADGVYEYETFTENHETSDTFSAESDFQHNGVPVGTEDPSLGSHSVEFRSDSKPAMDNPRQGEPAQDNPTAYKEIEELKKDFTNIETLSSRERSRSDTDLPNSPSDTQSSSNLVETDRSQDDAFQKFWKKWVDKIRTYPERYDERTQTMRRPSEGTKARAKENYNSLLKTKLCGQLITPEVIDKAARSYFKHMPDDGFGVANCSSWLKLDNIEQYLEEESLGGQHLTSEESLESSFDTPRTPARILPRPEPIFDPFDWIEIDENGTQWDRLTFDQKMSVIRIKGIRSGDWGLDDPELTQREKELHPDYRKEESSGLPADDTIELTPEEIAEMERVCNEPPPF